MTEEQSIVAIERQQASEQADIRAAQALERAGIEGASSDTVKYLVGQFPELGRMQAILKEYGSSVNAIANDVEADEEARVERYGEHRDKLMPRYQEESRKLTEAVSSRRAQYH